MTVNDYAPASKDTPATTRRRHEESAMSPAPIFPLAVTSEMLFLDLPYLERVRRIHELGFQVEMWDWTTKDLDAVAAIGATWSTMTGYLHGDLYDQERGQELVRTARLAVDAAKQLDCPRLVVHGAELDGSRNGLPFRPQPVTTGRMWLDATGRSSSWRSGRGERRRLLPREPQPARRPPRGAVRPGGGHHHLVETLDRPGVRLMLDLYHAQIGEGNLVELIHRAGALIGEVQVADVPGRMEPGTGEVNWTAIARALEDIGYAGVVGLESSASGDAAAACEAFRTAFSR
jgi:hydroxypyruvate isomerase